MRAHWPVTCIVVVQAGMRKNTDNEAYQFDQCTQPVHQRSGDPLLRNELSCLASVRCPAGGSVRCPPYMSMLLEDVASPAASPSQVSRPLSVAVLSSSWTSSSVAAMLSVVERRLETMRPSRTSLCRSLVPRPVVRYSTLTYSHTIWHTEIGIWFGSIVETTVCTPSPGDSRAPT